MAVSRLLAAFAAYSHLTYAACPLMDRGEGDLPANHPVTQRNDQASTDTEQHLSQFYLDDSDVYMTSDAGGPMSDQDALKAGERGPTLLEDFINRQKVRHIGCH
jgi:catalase